MARNSLTKQIDSITRAQGILATKHALMLDKALNSDDPVAIIKAQGILTNIDNRVDLTQRKATVLDPLDFASNFGYKNRNLNLSYEMLRRMSNNGIIAAIHVTRKNQIATFAEAQDNKYNTGYIIRKKRVAGQSEKQPSKQEQVKIELLTEFILNCGRGNVWDNDDFDGFLRKFIGDSLSMDQAVFDVVPDNKGVPFTFGALDAATFRVADSFVDDEYQGRTKKPVRGYLPNYVQLDHGTVSAEFYPWELCFGVRNPSTNMYNVGYGISEQEMLINQITSMLWSEEYNRKFFSQGSMPKGFIRVDSTIPPQKIAEFRQAWQAMALGLPGAHRTPILEAGKIDWVDLHKSNNDMEFSKWYEFLIKLSTAIYSIDPAEVNFPLSGGSDSKPMFEGSNEARLKHSKDKGLYPLLKFIQSRINKYVIRQIDPAYEFVFVGMDGINEADELDSDIRALTNFETLNEVRKRRNLPTLGEEGDIVLNSAFLQNKAQAAQAAMMAGPQGGDPNEEGMGEFDDAEQDPETEQDPEDGKDNPFEKAFNSYLKQLN